MVSQFQQVSINANILEHRIVEQMWIVHALKRA